MAKFPFSFFFCAYASRLICGLVFSLSPPFLEHPTRRHGLDVLPADPAGWRSSLCAFSITLRRLRFPFLLLLSLPQQILFLCSFARFCPDPPDVPPQWLSDECAPYGGFHRSFSFARCCADEPPFLLRSHTSGNYTTAACRLPKFRRSLSIAVPPSVDPPRSSGTPLFCCLDFDRFSSTTYLLRFRLPPHPSPKALSIKWRDSLFISYPPIFGRARFWGRSGRFFSPCLDMFPLFAVWLPRRLLPCAVLFAFLRFLC